MSNGENLLSLQEVDIELSQLKDKLAQLPELKDLAKKRRALAAAKEELLKVVALRKDASPTSPRRRRSTAVASTKHRSQLIQAITIAFRILRSSFQT